MSPVGSWAVNSIIVAALVYRWPCVGQPESPSHQHHTWTVMTAHVHTRLEEPRRSTHGALPASNKVRNLDIKALE